MKPFAFLRLLAGSLILCLSPASPAYSNDATTHPDYGQATLGVRMGDETGEGFLDLLIPAVRFDNGIFFVNPRASLKNEGANEFNLGIGYRHLIGSNLAVIGANIYYDSRESPHGNRFTQFGTGLEVLSKWVDFRCNYYDADNSPQLYNEYSTTETTQTTSTRTQVVTTTSTSYSDPFANGYAIWVDQETTRIIREITRQTTRTLETTRVFREYEAGMDGYDAELGVLLPLPDVVPECRIFGGYYSYDNDFGPDIRGLKGRIEIRTGPYLTIDGEVFEDKELNGSGYFVGFRLQIPLKGSYTWNEIRKGLTQSAHPDLRKRMNSEMVMRDVRIQKKESGPVEDTSLLRQTESVAVKTVTSRNTRTSSSQRLKVASDITFVDGTANGPQNGTVEHPFNTIDQGINHAGRNRTIFVTGMADGSTYRERVTLQPGQTLTSEILLPNGIRSYTSKSVPILHPQASYTPVITMSANTTVERIHVISEQGPGIFAYAHTANSSFTIRNSTVTATGNSYGIWIINHEAESKVTISNSNITTRQDWIHSILIEHEYGQAPHVSLNNNTITTYGNQAHAAVIDLAFSANGTVTARNNTVTTWGESADGILMDAWYSTGSSFTATGNYLTAEGDGPFGYGINYIHTGATGDFRNDTTGDNSFGLIITMTNIDPGTLSIQPSPALYP